MDQPLKEEHIWETSMEDSVSPLDESGPPRTDRRHSSSASNSTGTTGDSNDSLGQRSRRSRPSVVSASSQLPTVKEKNQQRAMSIGKPPSLAHLTSEETVISSKKVTIFIVIVLVYWLTQDALQVLTDFSKVATRNIEKEDARRRQLDRYNEENNGQREVYRRLKNWADGEVKGIKERLLSWAIPQYRRPPLPHIEELKALARHYYTPRSELKCHVCDFGEGRAEHTTVDLGQLEEYWQTKPEWVDVRWIHAPLGLGLTHSSVEDIFLHDGISGREFEYAGRSGWPYLETEILNFRHRENFQEMRDVYLLLHENKVLHEDLNESTWKSDQNASLHSDIDWRANHLAMDPTFWNLVDSDMPWQLSEGLAMGSLGPRDGLRPVSRHVDKQTISSYPFYKDAQLVRNPFRTFHRGDGFLLTLSPMAGINYLDKNFGRHLAEPIDAMFDNDDASAVGHVFQAFADQGTSTWHRRSVEWFLIYMLTEVGVTPHNFRQGCNAPSFESAYSTVIQDLKRRRYDAWKPNKTVELVREYLNCIDEVTTIRLILQKKMELFKIMQQDIKKFESVDTRNGKVPDNPDGETSPERLVWATNLLHHQNECFERLLIDLKQSMDAVS